MTLKTVSETKTDNRSDSFTPPQFKAFILLNKSLLKMKESRPWPLIQTNISHKKILRKNRNVAHFNQHNHFWLNLSKHVQIKIKYIKRYQLIRGCFLGFLITFWRVNIIIHHNILLIKGNGLCDVKKLLVNYYFILSVDNDRNYLKHIFVLLKLKELNLL